MVNNFLNENALVALPSQVRARPITLATIRVGDDAAESHAYVRASKVVKSDGTTWEHAVPHEEISRQLTEAADGVCPECAALENC